MELDFLSFPNNGINQEISMLTKLQTAMSNMSGKILELFTQLTFTLCVDRPWLAVLIMGMYLGRPKEQLFLIPASWAVLGKGWIENSAPQAGCGRT